MTFNNKTLPGASPEGSEKCGADRANDRARLQNSTSETTFQDFDAKAYRLAVRRACADAYVLLKDFPARIRYSYCVDRHGKLIPRAERRAGT
ncbi:hypothetical protein [Prosthecochloris vibrioformis]|uniref:Uncharacterized protein n=1 Tax=Prosthecochloris vibrioformis TaxID=1098 RepID=A0A5C4S270_PROVB|nr:hypothetical protein [Prosthecochloris vibrioformis]TNJ37405.1 hypothetical protein FGF68_04130 [Prosthecochloris vibrioformis]